MQVSSPGLFREPVNKNTPLPDGFEPGDHDVQCGRMGKQAYCSIGNTRFRLLIAKSVERYQEARSKLDKSLVVVAIVDAVRSRGGGFVKQLQSTNKWVDIGDKLARDKVGHSLRDTTTALEAHGINPLTVFGDIDVQNLMIMTLSELKQLERRIQPRSDFTLLRSQPTDVRKPTQRLDPAVSTVNTMEQLQKAETNKLPSDLHMDVAAAKDERKVAAREKSSVPADHVHIDDFRGGRRTAEALDTATEHEPSEEDNNLAFSKPFHSVDNDDDNDNSLLLQTFQADVMGPQEPVAKRGDDKASSEESSSSYASPSEVAAALAFLSRDDFTPPSKDGET